MALWQFDFLIVPSGRAETMDEDNLISWKGINISLDILNYLNSILERKNSWSQKIQQFGKKDSTSIELYYDNDLIDEISCQLDLRNLSKRLLQDILEFIKQIGGNIYYNKNIYRPDFNTIVNLMKSSDAARFCNDPQKYFKEL